MGDILALYNEGFYGINEEINRRTMVGVEPPKKFQIILQSLISNIIENSKKKFESDNDKQDRYRS